MATTEKRRTQRRRAEAPRKPARGDAVEQHILAIADPLFCERGYEGVSVQDVADAADVNKAIIYYYFAGKPGLFDRVVAGYYQAHEAALAAALAEPGTFRERMARVIDAYMDFMGANARYARLIQHEVARGDATRLARIGENLGGMLKWTETALRGALPARGPLAAKHFFLTISAAVINYHTYGPVLASLWGRDPLGRAARDERREHVRFVVDTLLDRIEKEGRRKGR